MTSIQAAAILGFPGWIGGPNSGTDIARAGGQILGFLALVTGHHVEYTFSAPWVTSAFLWFTTL